MVFIWYLRVMSQLNQCLTYSHWSHQCWETLILKLCFFKQSLFLYSFQCKSSFYFSNWFSSVYVFLQTQLNALVYQCSVPHYWVSLLTQTLPSGAKWWRGFFYVLSLLFHCNSSWDPELHTKSLLLGKQGFFFLPCVVENSTPSQHNITLRLQDAMSLFLQFASVWHFVVFPFFSPCWQ